MLQCKFASYDFSPIHIFGPITLLVCVTKNGNPSQTSMSSNPSSTCATYGSARRCVPIAYLLPFSPTSPRESPSLPTFSLADKACSSRPSGNPSTQKHVNSHSASASTSTHRIEQCNLSAYRINDYVTDPGQSHVQHRHTSSQEAMETHATAMRSFLEAFDATMKRLEK